VNLVFLRALKAPPAAFAADADEPIRAELFSIERLEQHAESLAAAQPVTTRPKTGRRLTSRLRENGRVLLDAYHSIASALREERAITPAAEWLVDNFHVVEEQIREIRDDLPRGFFRPPGSRGRSSQSNRHGAKCGRLRSNTRRMARGRGRCAACSNVSGMATIWRRARRGAARRTSELKRPFERRLDEAPFQAAGCRTVPSVGAPRIDGELLKLGIRILEATVSKYMTRSHWKPPSQTWRTFLENHIGCIFVHARFGLFRLPDTLAEGQLSIRSLAVISPSRCPPRGLTPR
jgi:hypothetical protein